MPHYSTVLAYKTNLKIALKFSTADYFAQHLESTLHKTVQLKFTCL